MHRNVISRQRVIDHGEVLTPPGLVNDMLNLHGVSDECERIDSRFLEPACGNGNFLIEVLRRRLSSVSKRSPRAIVRWEKEALLGLSCLYGIELLYDNVNECRIRLHTLFDDTYRTRFGSKAKAAVSAAAREILRCNILQGDALKMTTVDDKVTPARPLIFVEWSMLGGKFQRRLFEYHELTRTEPKDKPPLFGGPVEPIVNDHDGRPVYIATSLKTLPLVHYLNLGHTHRTP